MAVDHSRIMSLAITTRTSDKLEPIDDTLNLDRCQWLLLTKRQYYYKKSSIGEQMFARLRLCTKRKPVQLN
jgi:hypothetical protein